MPLKPWFWQIILALIQSALHDTRVRGVFACCSVVRWHAFAFCCWATVTLYQTNLTTALAACASPRLTAPSIDVWCVRLWYCLIRIPRGESGVWLGKGRPVIQDKLQSLASLIRWALLAQATMRSLFAWWCGEWLKILSRSTDPDYSYGCVFSMDGDVAPLSGGGVI